MVCFFKELTLIVVGPLKMMEVTTLALPKVESDLVISIKFYCSPELDFRRNMFSLPSMDGFLYLRVTVAVRA